MNTGSEAVVDIKHVRRLSARQDFGTIPVSTVSAASGLVAPGNLLGAIPPMPQMHLPLFPDGVEHITAELAFEKKDGQVTYFNGHMPVFIHAEADIATFRMITAQFCVNGNAKQSDISRAFGITPISVKRAVKRYREQGVAGFYAEPKRRGPVVLTPEVLTEAQGLLEEGLETSEVAVQLSVKRNTLAKAIGAGRLHKPAKKKTAPH